MAILIPKMEMPLGCMSCRFITIMKNTFGDTIQACHACGLSSTEIHYTARMEDCPLKELPPIEELMEPMCDQCQWPGWYKDPDDMQREKCSRCPVEAKLMEALYDDA